MPKNTLTPESIYQVFKEFIAQSYTDSHETKKYKVPFAGFDMNAGFGQGRTSRVPWFGFFAQGQTPQCGIYPVCLYYKQHDLFIVSYGVSQTTPPIFFWGDVVKGKSTIEKYLNERGIANSYKNPSGIMYGNSIIKYAFNGAKSINELNNKLFDDVFLNISEILEEYTIALNVHKKIVPSYSEKKIGSRTIKVNGYNFNYSELERMKKKFLKAMPGFTTFAAPCRAYLENERNYKLELNELFALNLLPTIDTSVSDEIKEIPKQIAAFLSSPLKANNNKPQNLIDWRTTAHLTKLLPEDAHKLGELYQMLVNSASSTVEERLDAFEKPYKEAVLHSNPGRPSGRIDQGKLRLLTSIMLSCYAPLRYIFVKTSVFIRASELLLGRSICADYTARKISLGQEYKQILEFSKSVELALADWKPQDFVDIQSFLWVATQPEAEIAGSVSNEVHSAERAYHHILLGEKSSHAATCLIENFIGADFGIRQDLSEKLPDSFPPFRNTFAPIYQETHPEADKRASGLACGSLWIITKYIFTGDIVLCPDESGHYNIGEVIGDYSYVPGEILPHRRAVRWLAQGIDRSEMSVPLKKSLVFMCVASQIKGHGEEIERLLEKHVNSNFASLSVGTLTSLHDLGKYSSRFQKHLQHRVSVYREPDFSAIQVYIQQAGMVLSENLLRRYHLSLKIRGFVILAGVSGTGKTWLAELYAKAIGGNITLLK